MVSEDFWSMTEWHVRLREFQVGETRGGSWQGGAQSAVQAPGGKRTRDVTGSTKYVKKGLLWLVWLNSETLLFIFPNTIKCPG